MSNPERWVSDCLKKKRYDTRALARRVKRRIEKQRDVKLRVYYCPHCSGTHLTKKL